MQYIYLNKVVPVLDLIFLKRIKLSLQVRLFLENMVKE